MEGPDFIEAGQGETVVLIHSSVAGARQWTGLMAHLSDEFHLIAINLFGYGHTPEWPGDRAQTLEDQASLITPFLPRDGGPISLVGHSFGGSVAMKAALQNRDRVRRLVLIEPNPFYLLQRHDRDAAFAEAVTLRDVIRVHGKAGDWSRAAEVFADYWTGAGSWAAMPEARQSKFAQALQPNFHEWDAVMNELAALEDWREALPRDTTIVSAADTVRSIREIVELMAEGCPDWTFEEIERGGHMAVLSRPEEVHPIVARALR